MMKRFTPTNETRHAPPIRFTFEQRDVDAGKRTITASLSSDTPIERPWIGVEILEHTRSAIDFSRARDGLPLLAFHDTHQPIGRAENVRLEGKKLRADLRFSAEEDAAKIWRMVEEGTLRDTSLGYKILDFVELDGEEEGVRITRWTPIEASIVTTPADPTAGVNRSLEENRMADTDTNTQDTTSNNVVDFTRGEKAERKRVVAIQRLFDRPLFKAQHYKDLCARCIGDGVGLEQARSLLLEAMGEGVGPSNDIIPQAPGSHFAASQTWNPYTEDYPVITAGIDGPRELDKALSHAIVAKAGYDTSKIPDFHPGAQDFRHLEFTAMARTWLQSRHVQTSLMTADQVWQRAIGWSSGAVNTSDYSAVLVDALNAALVISSQEAANSYDKWTGKYVSPDFRQIHRPSLAAGYSELQQVYENGALKNLQRTEGYDEQYQISSYGGVFRLTRQLLTNDARSLQAFQDYPRAFILTGARKLAGLVYTDTLLANSADGPVMADGNNLFDASNHHNVLAGSGPLSAASLASAVAALRKMPTLGDNGYCGAVPKTLLVPCELEVTALTLVSSMETKLEAGGSTTPALGAGGAPSPFKQLGLQVVCDPRLDDVSTTTYYVIADPATAGFIEIATLEGTNGGISTDQEEQFGGGLSIAVLLDAGVKAIDHRGGIKVTT